MNEEQQPRDEQQQPRDEQQQNRRRWRLRLDGLKAEWPVSGGLTLAGSGFIAAVIVVLAWWLFQQQSQVEVPNLIGMSRAAAEAQLKDKGLTLLAAYEETSAQPAGTVLRTHPPVGAKLKDGSGVSLLLAASHASPAATQAPGTTNPFQNPFQSPFQNLAPAPNPAPYPVPYPAPYPNPAPNPAPPAGQRSGPGPGPGPVTPEPPPPPLAVSVALTALRGSYTGSCPPHPSEAPYFQAVISVPAGPTTVTYRWRTSNGGSSDPDWKTINFPGAGPQQQTVYHAETSYLPEQTVQNWMAVDISRPITLQSNRINYITTCETENTID